jgi:xylulokinase
MGSLIAGVDTSTQATKVLVVDSETGTVVAQGRAGHTVTGERGARETDPREWWQALRAALVETGRAAEVEAIAVGGQQHGLVALGADGEPLRPSMLWNDTRSAPQAVALTEAIGAERLADRVGSRPVASFTATKWAWLREHEPATADSTRAIRLPHDYLTERLTGNGVTDRGDASGTAWWSSGDEAYARDILDHPLLRIDEAMLPRVLGPREVAGEVTAAAAEATGLRTGTVVGPGTGDNMGAALGLGLAAGQVAVSLGTSGTAYAVSERRTCDPSGIVAGFADATGRFLPLACTLNCTLAVDRVAELFGLDRDDVAPSGEVVALPWFDGERTPDLPNAAGTIAGMRHDTRPQQVLMAAYEGAIASLLDAVDAIAEQTGGLDPAAPLVVLGGGAKGRTWVEVVRRLSGRPVLIPDAQELVAIGAAVQAAAILRDEDAGAVATRWGTRAGTLLDAVPRDDERLERIGALRNAIVETPALAGTAR